MPSVYIQSSVFLPTPSGGAGAVELLVAKMAEGLAKRSWDVTLFGLLGSAVEGAKVVTVSPAREPAATERTIIQAMQMIGIPDVIFDHSLYMLAGQWRRPYVAMSHGMAPLPSWAHNVVFTSKHHGRLHGRKDPQALLLGIDLADIPPSYDVVREGLFWAGRIMPYKRLHLACEIARLAGKVLRVAGPVVDAAYWARACSDYAIHEETPLCNSGGAYYDKSASHIHYLGELPRAQVLEEMATARYFLFTSDETEPAGLTMLEAMACGTPVIALNDGSALEYVGGGGWVYPGEDVGAAAAGINSEKFQPDAAYARFSADARQHVESRFTIDHMVDRAEEYLRRAMNGERW